MEGEIGILNRLVGSFGGDEGIENCKAEHGAVKLIRGEESRDEEGE